MDENFDYAGLINQLEEHMENPRFRGLLDTYTTKATCIHPQGEGKVLLTLKIEANKLIDAGLEIEGCTLEVQNPMMLQKGGFNQPGSKMLFAQSSLYLESSLNVTLKETFVLAGDLLKQIKDDPSKESRYSMMFLTAFKDCVEAYYEKEAKERVTTLSF